MSIKKDKKLVILSVGSNFSSACYFMPVLVPQVECFLPPLSLDMNLLIEPKKEEETIEDLFSKLSLPLDLFEPELEDYTKGPVEKYNFKKFEKIHSNLVNSVKKNSLNQYGHRINFIRR